MEYAKRQLNHIVEYMDFCENFVNVEYPWEKVFAVVMPFNYPFEGAAHPHLYYINQSVLKSRRTGASVIMNTVANSFFGNMMTIANWRNLWLERGFSTYL